MSNPLYDLIGQYITHPNGYTEHTGTRIFYDYHPINCNCTSLYYRDEIFHKTRCALLYKIGTCLIRNGVANIVL